MESMRYYVMGEINLNDIANRLSELSYRTLFQISTTSGRKMVQIIQLDENGEQVNKWLCKEREETWFDIDQEDIPIFISFWHNVKSMFTMSFSFNGVDDYRKMLDELLVWFGGIIYYEGKIFTSKDIDRFLAK